jgi:hypothetical protein
LIHFYKRCKNGDIREEDTRENNEDLVEKGREDTTLRRIS